jgi:methylase of polypeptide subunit release factors
MLPLPESSRALVELGRELEALRYDFVTVTPATHRRVVRRRQQLGGAVAVNLRDVFGWNLVFDPSLLDARLRRLMERAQAIEPRAELACSRVRFSTLRGKLFAHSAFPTDAADAVFFGPDTYRFCAWVERWAPPARRLVDVGCGSGAGGICAAARAEGVVLADIAPRALDFARVNLELNGVRAEVVRSDVLTNVAGDVDLVIANPPYIRDPTGRLYRDGGGAYGEVLSVRIVEAALNRLGPGGSLLLYTGAAIADGVDRFLEAVRPALMQAGVEFAYDELDPDVFGEELEQEEYRHVERIAVVGLRARVK